MSRTLSPEKYYPLLYPPQLRDTVVRFEVNQEYIAIAIAVVHVDLRTRCFRRRFATGTRGFGVERAVMATVCNNE